MVLMNHREFVCVLNWRWVFVRASSFDDDEIIHGVYKRFKNYDLHYPLYIRVTCFWEYVYICTSETCSIAWELNVRPYLTRNQIHVTTRLDIMNWVRGITSNRNTWIRTKPTHYTLRATNNHWVWSLKSRKQTPRKRRMNSFLK